MQNWCKTAFTVCILVAMMWLMGNILFMLFNKHVVTLKWLKLFSDSDYQNNYDVQKQKCQHPEELQVKQSLNNLPYKHIFVTTLHICELKSSINYIKSSNVCWQSGKNNFTFLLWCKNGPSELFHLRLHHPPAVVTPEQVNRCCLSLSLYLQWASLALLSCVSFPEATTIISKLSFFCQWSFKEANICTFQTVRRCVITLPPFAPF